jgi:tetratricopeptide (TPR) repeat protein
MKKMKQFLMVLLLVFSVSVVFSQDDNNDCYIKYNLFKGDYSSKKYDMAYENWLWCMDNCPTLSVNIYKMGIKIAEDRLENTSEADKPAARELVMRVYTQRLQHYPDDAADIYNDIASFKADQGASDDEVFGWIEKAFKADVTAVNAKNIYKYFDIILNRHKDTDAQKVFDTYDEVGDGLELKRAEYSKKIDIINAKDSTRLSSKDIKNRDAYQQVLTNLSLVETGLDAKLSAISTCENLIPLNKKYFEENKKNAEWLKRAVSRMFNKECTDDPFYAILVEAYVHADPSPQASVFYAGILMNKGETNKAMEYFKKAIDQETDSYKKATNLLKVAQILSKQGRKSEARTYCYRALDNAPTMGRAYLIIAGMYASSANSCGDDLVSKRMVYVAALNMAYKAKSVDPSISGLANKYIASYSENVPTTKDLFIAGVKSGTPFKIGCWINETVRVP